MKRKKSVSSNGFGIGVILIVTVICAILFLITKKISVEHYRLMFGIILILFLVTILVLGLVWFRYNQKTLLIKMTLETLGESYPRIAKIDFRGNECIIIKDNERPEREPLQKLSWEPFRQMYLETLHPEDIEMARVFTSADNMRRICEANQGDSCVYRRMLNGEYQWIQTTAIPIKDKKNTEKDCILLCAKNVDDSVKAAELHKNELEAALKRARESESEKKGFLRYMSYEFVVPMNIIRERSERLKEALAKGNLQEAKEHQRVINGASRYMDMMIRDFRNIGVREERKYRTQKAEFTIEDLLEVCGIAYQEIVNVDRDLDGRQRNVELSIEADENLEKSYCGDETRLLQILFALLSNAYKFSINDGNILLKIRLLEKGSKKDRICIEVKDCGCGMKEEVLGNIYDPFYKEYREGAGFENSVGLGLPLAKMAVEVMEGTIDVESSQESGTTFRVQVTLDHKE